jgi:hypothetical protein
MVLVLVFGGISGWSMHRVRKQHEAVVAARRAGSWVIYQWQWNNGRFLRSGKPHVPRWLLDRLGPDFFYRVKRVDIVGGFGGHADDDLMTKVAWLSDLESLNLDGNKDVTEVGVAHLQGMTQLLYLGLSETGVRDAGLAHLKGLRNLRSLHLDRNKDVTEVGVAHLQGLTQLLYLDLSETGVRDAGLAHLKGLRNLRWLKLSNTEVTDAGMLHLKGLSSLEELQLSGTKVSGAAVNELAKLLPSVHIIREN